MHHGRQWQDVVDAGEDVVEKLLYALNSKADQIRVSAAYIGLSLIRTPLLDHGPWSERGLGLRQLYLTVHYL